MAESSRTLLKAAFDALASSSYEEAIRCCKLVLKNDRNNYDAYLIVGKALFASKQYAKADASYRRAVAIRASALQPWQGLAEVHEATGDIPNLVEACESAIRISEETGDVPHLVEYMRSLALTYARVADHNKAHRVWQAILELPSISEALRLEALCGIIDVKAGLMESHIQKECERRLIEDKAIDAASARCIAENDWISCEESQKLEEMLWFLLEQLEDSEKYKTLLLQLLVCRLRVMSLSGGQESAQLQLKITHLSLSMLSQFASAFAAMILFGMCEEDNINAIFNELGRPDLAQGRVNRLTSLGKKLLHCYPDQGLAMSALALAMHQSGSSLTNLVQKRNYCETALRLNENSIVGWQVLAQLRADERAYGSAAECIRRGHEVISRFRSLYGLSLRLAELNLELVSGDLLFKRGVYDEASRAFEEIVETAKGLNDLDVSKILTSAFQGKVMVLLAQGQNQEVPKVLTLLLLVDGNNAWALAELGWLAYENKEFEQAAVYLEKAVGVAPQRASYHYRLGLLYWVSRNKLKCKEKALVHLLESAKLDSSCSDAFRVLGHYYRDEHGGRSRAIRCYQKALLLNCEDEEAGEALCDLLETEGQEVLAITSCQSACEGSPRAFWAFRRLGYIQTSRKQWHEAVKSLQYAVRGYPLCAEVWEAIGVAYQQLGMLTAALKAYGHVLASQQSSPIFALIQSGNILMTLGIYREAINMFNIALAKKPELVAGQYGIASALLGLADECRLKGAISWSSTLLQEASAFASKSVYQQSNFASLWKLVGDIEMAYAKTLPWDYSYGDAFDEEPSLENYQSSLRNWNRRCFAAGTKAKCAYQHALHLQPWESSLYLDLCACLEIVENISQDNFNVSILALSKETITCSGLALGKNNVDLWTALGTVAREKGIRQHALIQALMINGNHALAWAQLGHMYLKEGDEELAKEAFSRARIADPTLALTWAAMSAMHVMRGSNKTEEAFANILYSVQLLPIADFQLGLGKIAASANQLHDVQVFAAIGQAVLRAPHMPEAHNLKGLACEVSGYYQPAISSFKMALVAFGLDVARRPVSHEYAIRINLARALVKRGDTKSAVEQYEILARSGCIDDSSTLRGYATALWHSMKRDVAITFATAALKKSNTLAQVSASTVTLNQIVYSLRGPASVLENIDFTILDLQSELALTVFAIACIAGKSDILLQKMASHSLVSSCDKLAELAVLVALSLQLSDGFNHVGALQFLKKMLHVCPGSLLVRTELIRLLLQVTDGMDVGMACRCLYSNLSSVNEHSEMKSILATLALACSICGNIKSQCTFSSCLSQQGTMSSTIQEMQRWMHLQPWNVSSQYHLILCLFQTVREQHFPTDTCRLVYRMAMAALTRLPHDNAGNLYLHMQAQLLVCASEVILHLGEIDLGLRRALKAATLPLPKHLLSLVHLQLARLHAVNGDRLALEAEYPKIIQLEMLDISTYLSIVDIGVRCNLLQNHGELTGSHNMRVGEDVSDIARRRKALLSFKHAELCFNEGDVHGAEKAAKSAAALDPGMPVLYLLHGAICLELSRIDSGYAAPCVRSLSKLVSGSVCRLPIAGFLLAQAQAAPQKWEKYVRAEWSMWPPDCKPAELYFQMGLLARRVDAASLESQTALEPARSWFRRAVHLNPSCSRYWALLLQGGKTRD